MEHEHKPTRSESSVKTLNWNRFLSSQRNLNYVPPVNYFPHAPLADVWETFSSPAVGRWIEIPNPYVEADNSKVYWVAIIRSFAGYKALVEFERFGMKPKHFEWISFCSTIPKPLGYCTRNRILLHPMLDVADAFPNFIEKLGETTRPYLTVREDHGAYVRLNIKETHKRYPLRSKLEAVDRTYISRVRMATVTGYIGDRLHITYDVEPVPNDEGFIFSVHSDSIHPTGWAKEVGHEIFDPIEIIEPFPVDKLPKYPSNIVLRVGQLLEARHPLEPYVICTSTVYSILKHGYFMASFRSSSNEMRRPTLHCFHITSPYIFPVGFCKRNRIKIRESLNKDKGSPAPLHLLPPRASHQFTKGLKFEAVDICDPAYLGPVTVLRVVEHLLLLFYDGWNSKDHKNRIWYSADSPNLYPLGFGELTGYKFQSVPSDPKLS